MKNILLASLLLLASFNSFSQTQISNGDFENWTTFSHCSGIDSVANFTTYDEYMYYYSLVKVKSGFCTETPSPVKSTDAQSGNYALQLKALNVEGLIANNFVTIGAIEKIDAEGVGSYGIPFTGRPARLTGYYTFNKGGSDVLDIAVGAYNNESEDDLFYGEFTATATQSTYKKFSITLEYDPSNASNSSVLYLTITMGDADGQGGADETSVALIDNLVFEYDATTSVSPYTTSSPVNVYAANDLINFSEQVSEITVTDLVGAQKIVKADATKTVQTDALNNGLYIITYKYKDSYFSKKIVLE